MSALDVASGMNQESGFGTETPTQTRRWYWQGDTRSEGSGGVILLDCVGVGGTSQPSQSCPTSKGEGRPARTEEQCKVGT